MRIFTVLTLSVLLMSCDGSLMSQSERDAITELACTELRATDEDQSLQRLRIVNTAREKLGGDVFLGDDDDIERYLRWETCEQFIEDSGDYVAETTRREQAYSLIERNAEKEDLKIRVEYFTDEKYLIHVGTEKESELIDTATMSDFSGTVKGIRRAVIGEDKGTRYRTERAFSDGRNHGAQKDWYLSGQKSVEVTHVDGKLDGLARRWFANGQLYDESNYVDGISQGTTRTWHENGQLRGECERVDGDCDGLVRGWYSNGQQLWEWTVRNGERNGLLRSWRLDGQLFMSSNYVDGKQHGVSREWDEEGNLTKEETYVNGVIQ